MIDLLTFPSGLDPPGYGFSTRGTLAIILGCVPVFVGRFRRPFQSSVVGMAFNYEKFSITIPASQVTMIREGIC